MGGELICSILEAGSDRIIPGDELILCPHTHPEEVRRFLRNSGYRITDEDMVYDEGKYYRVIKAVYDGQDGPVTGESAITDMNGEQNTSNINNISNETLELFSEILIKKKHPVLRSYLEFEKDKYTSILKQLSSGDSGEAAQRSKEIAEYLGYIEEAEAALKAADGS